MVRRGWVVRRGCVGVWSEKRLDGIGCLEK